MASATFQPPGEHEGMARNPTQEFHDKVIQILTVVQVSQGKIEISQDHLARSLDTLSKQVARMETDKANREELVHSVADMRAEMRRLENEKPSNNSVLLMANKMEEFGTQLDRIADGLTSRVDELTEKVDRIGAIEEEVKQNREALLSNRTDIDTLKDQRNMARGAALTLKILWIVAGALVGWLLHKS